MNLKKIILVFFILFSVQISQAKLEEKKISLDLKNVSIQDALHSLAKIIGMNLVLSQEVHGSVSLYLQDSSPQDALEFLLASNDLIKLHEGKTWFVTSRAQLLSRKQEEQKLRIASEEAATMVTRVWQIHYAKASELAHLLQENTHSLLSPRGHVRVDLRTNMLCVQDIGIRMSEIDRLIKRLDIPVRQVLIEARLASVDSQFEKQLGVDFSIYNTEIPAANGHYSVMLAKLADGSALDVRLTALENAGHAELISNPSLFTANQQTASIEAGEEIPYQEVSKSGATSVAFKKAVLSLMVTPQIMPDNRVLLQLKINQDKPSSHLVLGVPTINTRQMSTNILLKNAQTVVLGGIYETDKENGQQGVPFLGTMPLVGFLFSQKNTVERKRELLIFVTPKIIG